VRILLFGGTFNPVHWGHLLLAEELREEFGYDLVLLVPAARPPHKEAVSDPGPSARLEMLNLAVAGNPGLAVDDCELLRGGLSYTADTLRDLPSRYAIEGRPGLAIGDDLAPGFPSWREPEAIAAMADIIVARRGGDFGSGEFPYTHRRANNRLIPLSSSEIRERVGKGLSIRYLVPEAVRGYILKGRLYGSPSS
jgi:nicotinate-nucleotide adenylyltransferase